MEYTVIGYQLPVADVFKAIGPVKRRNETGVPIDEQRLAVENYFRTHRLGSLVCLTQNNVVTIGRGMHVPTTMTVAERDNLLEKKDFNELKNSPLFKLLKKDDESVVKVGKRVDFDTKLKEKDLNGLYAITKLTDVKDKKKRKADKDKADEEKKKPPK